MQSLCLILLWCYTVARTLYIQSTPFSNNSDIDGSVQEHSEQAFLPLNLKVKSNPRIKENGVMERPLT